MISLQLHSQLHVIGQSYLQAPHFRLCPKLNVAFLYPPTAKPLSTYHHDRDPYPEAWDSYQTGRAPVSPCHRDAIVRNWKTLVRWRSSTYHDQTHLSCISPFDYLVDKG